MLWLLGIIIVAILLSMTAIIAYSMGGEASLGKPLPQELMKPGTRYAHIHNFVRVELGGTQERLALLYNVDGHRIEFCAPRQPLPGAQMIVAKDEIGDICLLPAPEAPPKPEPEPAHVNVLA